MEELDDEWINTKAEFEKLYHADTYGKLLREYLDSDAYSELGYEHLLVYFVYRYLMNAVYDYDILSYAKMIVAATLVVRDMDAARYQRNGGAISNGAAEGVKLAVNVAGMLLVFVAFIAFANYLFTKFGSLTGVNEWIAQVTDGRSKELNLQFILGYAISPLMWLIGIAPQDMIHAGSLLGQKIIMTEFIGYVDLANLKAAGAFAQTKSVIMCTYFLCGFANFASIGIQIGGIGGLTPKNKPLLAQFGMRALLAGTLASLLSATVVGMIIG